MGRAAMGITGSEMIVNCSDECTMPAIDFTGERGEMLGKICEVKGTVKVGSLLASELLEFSSLDVSSRTIEILP